MIKPKTTIATCPICWKYKEAPTSEDPRLAKYHHQTTFPTCRRQYMMAKELLTGEPQIYARVIRS